MSTHIPKYLQKLFDTSITLDDEIQLPTPIHQPTKALFPGDVGTVDLSQINVKHDEEDPILRAQDEAIKFIIPGRAVRHPPKDDHREPPQELIDRGEFWAHRLGPKIQRGVEVDWDKIDIQQDEAGILTRTVDLLKWMKLMMDTNEFKSSSRRKEVASILLELFEFLMIIGTRFDVVRIEYHDDIGMDSDILIQSVLSNDDQTTTIDNTSLSSNAISSSEFTPQLMSTMKLLIEQSSNKESYVMIIGVIQNKEIGLSAKLICLPYFASILKTFGTKRASYLISANSIIYSILLKEGLIPTQADASLIEATENEAVSGSRPIYYLQWIVGISRYLCQYFSILGDAAAVKQTDDFHGVGPNSCASLLSKVIDSI